MKTTATLSLLMAGLIAATGALAQGTPNNSNSISRGEIGTTDSTGQQAGLEVKPTDGKTRAELRTEKELKKAQHKADSNSQLMGARAMGGPNVGAPAGVPANAPAGSLSVQEGGTPN